MTKERIFMDKGLCNLSAVCPQTGSKFQLRMTKPDHGRIDIFPAESDVPIDAWYLTRDEMKTLFCLLSKPGKNKK